jgi:hypothetical protein
MYSIYPQTGEVKRNDDGVVVAPCGDIEELSYKQYLAWVEQGNEPVVVQIEMPEQCPQVVTPRQIRLALNQLGLRTAIEQAIAQADQDTKDTWEFSTEFQRSNPLVMNVGLALGKSAEEIDAVFCLAATL